MVCFYPPIWTVSPDLLVTIADERFVSVSAFALANQISTQQGQDTGYERGITLK